MELILFFVISLGSCIAGAICGIGGGVIIKPMLDMAHLADVAAISFLSGCTVLCMSCYSVARSLLSKEQGVDLKNGTPLAIGAALGGLLGKQLFGAVQGLFANPQTAGSVQGFCLCVITFGTMLYTVNKRRIATKKMQGAAVCIAIGLALGIMSSFLGIGGGPINLVVLYYFFSMDTKTAAKNSLYIILFSQAASFFMTVFTHTVPAFEPVQLIVMAAGGILGGVLGRKLNAKMDNHAVEKLFIGLMVVIMAISLYNGFYYLP